MKVEIPLEIILSEICMYYDFKDDELKERNRSKNITRARQMYFYLGYELSGKSYETIGRLLSREHSTVLFAHAKFSVQKDIYSDIREEIYDLSEMILKSNFLVKEVNLLELANFYSKTII